MSDFVVTVTPPIVYTVTVENIPPVNIDILLSPPVNVEVTTPGPQGIPGPGVPIGGTINQALTKIDGTNYNTEWSTIDKNFVGLDQVDNTADIDKPVSTAQQNALNLKYDASNPAAYVNAAGASAAAPVQSVSGKTGNVTLVKADVGLSNVQNLDQTDPSNIVQNSTHRFVTDAEKAVWNSTGDNFENIEWEFARYIQNNQYYKKFNYTGPVLNSIQIFDDNTEAVLQFTKTLNYTLGALTSIVITRAIDGAISTKTFNYTLGVLGSITYN